jgi:hypothetical protein
MYNGSYSMPYANNYSQQINPTFQSPNYDEYIKYLDKEKERVEKSKEQYMNRFQQQQQQPSINQTFQLAPSGNGGMKYANSIEDVSKEMVFYDTPFFTKDLSVVWIKNAKGEIKTFELTEIIPQDEKDIEIALLKAELEQMRKERSNDEQFNSNANAEQIETNATTIDESIGKPTKTSKSASVSRVSKSKAE